VFESLFHGYGPLMFAGSYATAQDQLREAARQALEAAAAEIRATHPGLTVEARMRDGLVAATLIEESQGALASVVGARGKGGFAGLTLGSVPAQVAAHGHGPIVVVRPATDPDGPILVGYDGSEAARAALSYAAQEALDQKKRLVVAHVYWEEPWGFHHDPAEDPRAKAERRAQALIAEGLELHLEEHPELDAETRIIHSLNSEYSMIGESARASLTVVGCRGRGGFAGLLLGSVSRTLVHHAAGPVVVIHPSEHE
jgi:nucleotide-binding universal stress UspA family protein